MRRRNAREISNDAPGMLRYALAAVVGALAAATLVGCSSTDTADRAPAPAPSQTSSTRAASATPAVSAATVDACRSLATNEDLAEFWRKLSNGQAVYGWDAQRATMAVMNLGTYTSEPGIDTDVSAVMSTAVTEMGAMNQEMAASGEAFDVDRFRGIITPVVTACQEAGVDMAVSE